MILYTILDPAEVLADPGMSGDSYEYYQEHGRFFRLRRDAGRLTLDRIISTDPRDYLRPGYRIGSPLPSPERAGHSNSAGPPRSAGK